MQQTPLAPETATVAAELAVLVDDPVARNDDRDPVQAVRPADRANRRGTAYLARDVGLRSRLPVRN